MAVVLVAGLFVAAFPAQPAYAAQITNRSLTLQAGASDGGSKPGGVVNHNFQFTVPTTATAIGSIKFEYCTTASLTTCVTPTGLSTTSATLGAEGAGGATGFSMNASANGAPILTKATAATPTSGNLSYRLDSVTNPNVPGVPNYTFFVRISTYNSIDATGSPIDTGSVAASTSTQIQLTGTMPESLIFCAGATVTTTSGVPDCSTATAGSVTFNQLFSPTDTATATSQMAASTNANFGYSITVNGVTMTSGSNVIPAMGSATTGTRGTGQFGMNLVANTTATSTPAVGTAVAPISNGTDLRANPQAGYESADNFKFVTGDSIAKSDSSTPGSPAATNAQIYTASYIVNVPGSQPAGTYVTTLTYICTPTF
jgi:hypothetical protein